MQKVVADAIMIGLGQLVGVRDKAESAEHRCCNLKVCVFPTYRLEWFGSNHGYSVSCSNGSIQVAGAGISWFTHSNGLTRN